MIELIPVVDENDRVVKHLPTEQIHGQGLCHREIVVYLLDKQGRVLVQKRDGGLFDHSVAGHIREGESYLQGALREVKEEVGLRLKSNDLKQIGKIYHQTPSGHKKGQLNNRFFGLYIVKRAINKDGLRINKKEMEDIEPMSVDKIKNIIKQRPKQCKGGFLVSFPLFLKYHRL